MNGIPSAADFQSRRVTNPEQSEIIRQRLYDYLLYPTAGQSQLSFFSQPAGQGITSALGATIGSAKTQWDTNLEIGNTLPSGKAFIIETIEVVFFPGSSNAANTFLPRPLADFEAVAADAVVSSFQDVNTFYQSGMLELNVLSKNYLRETPLLCFPSKVWFDGAAALAYATTVTTTNSLAAVNAIYPKGRPYYIDPTIALQPSVNFEIVVRWPAPIATPSGFNARVGVILDGFFMRASQ